MFEEIYSRDPGDKAKGRSVVGLFEELGELAEAVRVFERYPKYFVGEAADVFSYLMGIANEHALVEKAAGRPFSLERAYLQRYPGVCVQCGYPVCVCPVVPEATVGRLAKELDIGGVPLLAVNPIDRQRATGVTVQVWKELGGYSEIARQFPFDRGETNRALVVLCVQVADNIEASKPDVAKQLRDAAVTIGEGATFAGSRAHSDAITATIASLRSVWPLIESAVKPATSPGPTPATIARLLADASVQECRIGIVTALPKEFAAMRAMFEDSREFTVQDDPNDYVLGAIPARDGTGTHLVILTLAKKMGNNSAAAAATNLLRSFRKVRDVVMVGIAGGVPNVSRADRDVHLGDIVVSDKDGLVQYDNIKIEENSVEIRDSSTKPSALMLGRVQFLESDRIAGKRPWEGYIARGEVLENCKRPPSASDTLMSPDGKGELPRPVDPARRVDLPKIFYGRVGSANALLKSAKVRDLLRDKANIIAFEMEGSGVADSAWTFGQQYLLVRGICDYGDMSKVDQWQGYAAVVAAAYCRALIEAISVEPLT